MDLRGVAAETARGHRMPAMWLNSRHPLQIANASPAPADSPRAGGASSGRWGGFGLGKMPSITMSLARPMAWIGLTTQGGASVRCTHTRLPWATMFNAFGVASVSACQRQRPVTVTC